MGGNFPTFGLIRWNKKREEKEEIRKEKEENRTEERKLREGEERKRKIFPTF